ncbi:MAG: hypothetical protein G01um10143_832, partial [Parcubacteria group bacterium Gr01-1014_3]
MFDHKKLIFFVLISFSVLSLVFASPVKAFFAETALKTVRNIFVNSADRLEENLVFFAKEASRNLSLRAGLPAWAGFNLAPTASLISVLESAANPKPKIQSVKITATTRNQAGPLKIVSAEIPADIQTSISIPPRPLPVNTFAESRPSLLASAFDATYGDEDPEVSGSVFEEVGKNLKNLLSSKEPTTIKSATTSKSNVTTALRFDAGRDQALTNSLSNSLFRFSIIEEVDLTIRGVGRFFANVLGLDPLTEAPTKSLGDIEGEPLPFLPPPAGGSAQPSVQNITQQFIQNPVIEVRQETQTIVLDQSRLNNQQQQIDTLKGSSGSVSNPIIQVIGQSSGIIFPLQDQDIANDLTIDTNKAATFSTLTSGGITTSGLTVSGSGTTTFGGGVSATTLNVTSTTGTSTFAGGIELGSGCFEMPDGSCLEIGGGGGSASTAGYDGQVQFNSSGVLGASSLFTFASGNLTLGGDLFVNGSDLNLGNGLSATSTISGQYGSLGFGSSSPIGQISVEAVQGIVGSNTPIFIVGDSGSSTPFIYVSGVNGNVGIATDSPGAALAVDGLSTFNGVISNSAAGTSTFEGGINVKTTGGLSSAAGLTITGGDIQSSGKLTITSSATSSITGGLIVDTLTTGTTGTSTFGNGLILSAGSLKLATYQCNNFASGGVLTTDSAGNVVCSDDDTTAGSASGWTDTGGIVRLTTASDLVELNDLYVYGSDLFIGNGLQATTTVHGEYAKIGFGSTTPFGEFSIEATAGIAGTHTPIFVIGDSGSSTPFIYVSGNNGFVGIATDSPGAALAVDGLS